jgi:glycosyltransferase involved in cell wall biosynthesis
MRILYLHQYFTPPTESGGTRSYEFARRLIAKGHEVRILTSSAFLGNDWVKQGKRRACEIASIPVLVVDVPYSHKFGYARRLLAFLQFAVGASWRSISSRADVVFASSTPLTIGIPALFAARLQGIPMVLEVRDLWPEIPIAVGALRNPLLIAAARALECTLYRSAAHIVALSPGMKDGIVRQTVPEEKVTVIPNGSDLDLFTTDVMAGNEVRRKLGISNGDLLIVYAGTFGRVNGVRYIVELAARCQGTSPRIAFLLVGDGVERESLRSHAERRGVLDRNFWIWAPVPKSEMPKVLAAADACASVVVPIPEMWNNSANKFFDSLAAGRPIIINHGGWQAELVESTGCGLVLPPDDLDEAAERLRHFMGNAALRRRAAKAARTLAETRFDLAILTDRLESTLEKAVGRQVGQASAPRSRGELL